MTTKELREIYEGLPTIDCKKKCEAYCGAVPVGAEEEEFIAERYGPEGIPEPDDDLTCNQLTDKGLCGIHLRRPLICRLFGLVKDPKMRCPHGCTPSFWLSEGRARELIEIVIKDTPHESERRSNSGFHQKLREAKNQ